MEAIHTPNKQLSERKLIPMPSFRDVEEYLDRYEQTGEIDIELYRAIDIQVREADDDVPKDVPLVVEIQYQDQEGQAKIFRLVSNQLKNYVKPDSYFYKEIMQSEGIGLPGEFIEGIYKKYREFNPELKEAISVCEEEARKKLGDDYMDNDNKDYQFTNFG